jgi:hypothetical protein
MTLLLLDVSNLRIPSLGSLFGAMLMLFQLGMNFRASQCVAQLGFVVTSCDSGTNEYARGNDGN